MLLFDDSTPVSDIRQSLFSNSEQGFLYDLYDRSTLFQDAAGTTPWTAYGQPLGLQLDKSKGLVLGPELVQSLTSSSGWITAGAGSTWANTANGIVAVNTTSASRIYNVGAVAGSGYEGLVTISVTSGQVSVFTGGTSAITINSGQSGTFRAVCASATNNRPFDVRATVDNTSAVVSRASVRELPGNHRYQTTSSSRPTIEARVNRFIGTETLATQNVTTVAGGYILRFSGTGTVTLSGAATGAYSAGTHSITCTAGTLTATVAGTVTQADLRLSLDSAYPYQRVTTATDYADIGAPRRIKYDGIDDFLQTASVNFSATDKMTVWAGVRKLSDAAAAIICEFGTVTSASYPGSFFLAGPDGAAANLGFGLCGTAATAYQATGLPAPVSAVLSSSLDIAGANRLDEIKPRVNATVPTVTASGAVNAGTGNFGNYPLYFGARAGTSLRFSGEVFSPEVIRGAASTAAQIDMVERVINRNMGGLGF